MDLHEWELLPSDGFIDLHEDDGVINKNNISPSSNPNSVIDMNYFQKFVDPKKKVKINRNSVPVVPIKFDDGDQQEEEVVPEKEIPEDQSLPPPKKLEKTDVSQQVFFKKLKENEFADMKMDSPKSSNRGFVPQFDVVGTYQFEEKLEKEDQKPITNNKNEKGSNLNSKEDQVDWELDDHGDGDSNGGLNVWKWAMTGIGAFLSFGFAAATVSLIVLGNRHKDQHHHKSPEVHFQIYAHEKRMKQVVHHAKKLNDAITAVRGAPLTSRAHITIGGYYEGL